MSNHDLNSRLAWIYRVNKEALDAVDLREGLIIDLDSEFFQSDEYKKLVKDPFSLARQSFGFTWWHSQNYWNNKTLLFLACSRFWRLVLYYRMWGL